MEIYGTWKTNLATSLCRFLSPTYPQKTIRYVWLRSERVVCVHWGTFYYNLNNLSFSPLVFRYDRYGWTTISRHYIVLSVIQNVPASLLTRSYHLIYRRPPQTFLSSWKYIFFGILWNVHCTPAHFYLQAWPAHCSVRLPLTSPIMSGIWYACLSLLHFSYLPFSCIFIRISFLYLYNLISKLGSKNYSYKTKSQKWT